MTEAEISALVERFYAKVREDVLLGPIFGAAVHHWDAHLELLKDFWSSVLLTTGRYKGNPLLAHFNLPIGEAHFERWLILFAETAKEVMSPAGAKLIVERAQMIAANLKRNLPSMEGSSNGAGWLASQEA